MKVCFTTPYSPREISGVGQVVAFLAEALEKRDTGQMILTKTVNGEGGKEQGLTELGYREFRFFGGFLFTARVMLRIIRERKNIDLLHLHSISWMTAMSSFLGKLLGIPRVLTLHGKHPLPAGGISKFSFGIRERLAIGSASRITCVSKETRDSFGLDSAVIIRNGIDTSRFSPDADAKREKREELGVEENFVLLFVGRLDAQKGIYHTIEAMSSLAKENPKLRLVIVGSGEDEKVKESIKSLELQEFVLFLGGADNVLPFYQGSDIFVLFSFLEGIPLTLLEAMSCGLPCIATSVGGIPEVITNGIDGFLVKPGDRSSLEEYVSWCAANRTALEDISRKARETIQKGFNRDRMLEEYQEVYDSVLTQ